MNLPRTHSLVGPIIVKLLATLVVLLTSCTGTNTNLDGTKMEKDQHSFANHHEVSVKHIELDLTVDFDRRRLEGRASLYLENREKVSTLQLDAADLKIKRVTLDVDEQETEYNFSEHDPFLGRELSIRIKPETRVVNIYYATGPEAAALQWLRPSQTSRGKKPFLYTQSQAILARSWIPCQDNPAVRMTYNARIGTPPGMMAVMSARNDTTKHPYGVYEFSMPHPIPSYLMALAVGELEFRSMGPRSGVFAEPSVIDRATYEFGDTEKMIAAAERLYGSYRWDRYDILVLPPSFPFGGMENPMLTFATPTILAGDRSLVSLIAHELAHSWSGNLVTNATWNDFWLNEGFTVYFERRIIEELYGKERADMDAVIGFHDLMAAIKDLGADSEDTKLYLNLKGRNPDDAVNDVPYEKGYLFLRLLEEAVGRESWDAFLKEYFRTFAFQSMTTPRFISYLRQHLVNNNQAQQLHLESWAYQKGLPENHPKISSKILLQAEDEAMMFVQGRNPAQLRTSGWVTQQWVHFIRSLPDSLSPQKMKMLDLQFQLTTRSNDVILREWFLKSIATGYEATFPALEGYLIKVGRRWLIKPLYSELAKTQTGLRMARDIYSKARAGYHTLTTQTIDEILQWNKQEHEE